MASIFCPSCGSKSEYQFAAPNFCFKCGQPYLGATKQSDNHLLSKVKAKRRDAEEEIEDEEDDGYDDSETFSNSTRVPRLKSISVDIDSSTNIRVLKMSDLINGNEQSTNFKFGKRQNIDDIIDERNL